MSEFAYRKNDGEKVKIGTCEEMFYLRYEDRMNMRSCQGSINPQTEIDLFWRLPFPDEDGLLPGGYANHSRGERLYTRKDNNSYCEDFSCPEMAEQPGIIQLRHESGLLVNVPCFHGEKLPQLGDAKTFWNGKSWSYELRAVKNTVAGVLPVVTCRHCRGMWRCDWDDVLPYVADKELYVRLLFHKQQQQAA